MMQYSVVDRRPEESILELLKQHNISVLARGALAQGLLVDKPAKEYLGYSKEEIAQANKAIHSLSGPNRNAAQTAIQFSLNHPAVGSAVIGIRNRKQLKEAAAGGKRLLKKEVAILQEVLRPRQYEQHR